MTDPARIIQTNRLTLVPFETSHAQALFAMNSDPEVIGIQRHYDEDCLTYEIHKP